ncbi:MAG: MFS transporter [Anaerolineae bacterium]|nr:MFS transporter [Anaerolineae bacterium]
MTSDASAASVSNNAASSRRWLAFALICVPILIGSIDLTAIVVVLPQATLELLGPQGLARADQALWAVTAYLLAYTISLALVGRLSDVLPRKAVFVACIVIFILGALWSALATDFPMQLLAALPIWPDTAMLPLVSLIVGRVIQAIGAGASVSVGMALVSDIFPAGERDRPISLIGALDSLGWVIGNLYAGLMLQALPSWRWLFLINALVAGGALILTVIAVRGVRRVAAGARFDLRGAILFGLALTALTIGVEALNKPGDGGLILTGASLLLFVAFVWTQFRRRHALIDMHFVRQPDVRAALITNLIVGFGLILVVAGVPLIINLRAVFLRGEGLLSGALLAGIMLTALTAPLVVAALVGERRYHRTGAGLPVATGLALAILGFLLASAWTYTSSSLAIAGPLALIGAGLGLTIGPLSLAVMDAAEEGERGLASSLVLVMRLLGMTVGTPLAASLTLNLANVWADERANTLTANFRALARPMLVPPMATDALARVMLLGAAAGVAALVVFYLPRLWRAMRVQRWTALLGGAVPLVAAIGLVTAAAAWDTANNPTIVSNPVAAQLPEEVEFYTGVNLQQLFLLNSRRPLDAVVDIVDTVALLLPPPSAQAANAPPSEPPAQPEAPTGPTIGAPPQTQPPDTATDAIVRALFRPRGWTNDNYAAFCSAPENIPPSDWQWCFNNGLLSWIGPQAALALLPGDGVYDFLFAFQATNRNNAIQFVANLARALDLTLPIGGANDIPVLQINAGTGEARAVAITDAYVLVGTPGGVAATIRRSGRTLAERDEFRRIVGQLQPTDFATIFFRSSDLEGELRPALTSVFHSPVVDAAVRILERLSPDWFTRTSAEPVVMGIAMRVTETQVALNAVASLPVSLQGLRPTPVPANVLGRVPQNASVWLAADLDVAGMASQIDLQKALETVAQESGDAALSQQLSSPLVQGPLTAFGRALQRVLALARGEMLFAATPGDATGQPAAIYLPLRDGEGSAAVAALNVVRAQLELFALTGLIEVHSAPVPDGEGAGAMMAVTVGGPLVESFLPGGLHYALTADNVLLVAASENAQALAQLWPEGDASGLQRRLDAVLPAAPDRFLYAQVIPPQRGSQAALVLGGRIEGQSVYLDAVLQTD